MSSYTKCAHCKKWVPKGDTECPHCGAAVSPWAPIVAAISGFFGTSDSNRKNLLCVSCNKLVGENAEECPHCGAKQTARARFLRNLTGTLPTATSVTPILGGVLVMLYVLQGLLNLGRRDFDLWDFVISGDAMTTLLLGGMQGEFWAEGQWWRLINSNFLHFGLIHLAFNLSALRSLGPMIEEEYGAGWYMTFFLVTGIAGFAASQWWMPLAFTVGASASLFGLIGVGIGYAYRDRFRRRQQLKQLATWAGIGLLIGVLDIIPMNNAAHAGGLVAGLVFGYLAPPELASKRGFPRTLGTVLGYASLAVAFGGFVLAIMRREETVRIMVRHLM